MNLNIEEIEHKARQELEHEQFREAVEEAKARLRNKRSFLSRVFPFKIIIVRR